MTDDNNAAGFDKEALQQINHYTGELERVYRSCDPDSPYLDSVAMELP